jgi:anti-sigma regulatory factor (Ser/Thr protein kinase)
MLQAAVGEAARSGDVESIARAAVLAVPGEIDDDMAILVVRSSSAGLSSREKKFPAEPITVSEARRMALETFTSWNMDPEQAELACLLVSEVVTNAVLHAAATPSPKRDFAFESAVAQVPAAASLPASWDLVTLDGGPPDAAPLSAGPLGGGSSDGDQPGGSADHSGKEFTLRLRRGASAIWVEVFDADMRLPRIRTAGETDEGGRGLYLVEQLATRWGSRPTREGKAVWFEMPTSST